MGVSCIPVEVSELHQKCLMGIFGNYVGHHFSSLLVLSRFWFRSTPKARRVLNAKKSFDVSKHDSGTSDPFETGLRENVLLCRPTKL